MPEKLELEGHSRYDVGRHCQIRAGHEDRARPLWLWGDQRVAQQRIRRLRPCVNVMRGSKKRTRSRIRSEARSRQRRWTRVHTNRFRSKEDVGMSCKVSHGGMRRAAAVLDLYGMADGAASSTLPSSG